GIIAGAAGSSSMPGSDGATLSGSIEVISEPDLVNDRPLGIPLTVKAPGAGSSVVSVSSATDGTFSLSGVSPNTSLWMGVGAFSGDAASTYVDTLQLIDLSQASEPTLRVLRRDVLELIVQDSFLATPIQLDPAAATVIVNFLDVQGKGISGLTLLQSNPAASNLAYDFGQAYSDQAEQTSQRGSLLLVNVPSSPDPGSVTSLAAIGNGRRYDLDLHTVAGGVSIVTVQQSP
ncbi:MAG TPA: hypothetical protein VG963_00400, partial [Polyangiaceae bacterium]|nr:hypothetical protein [Polyangiaceae bacterium]